MNTDTAARQSHKLTLEEMRRDIVKLSGQPGLAIAADDDLVAIGLDSIDVMKLASIWYSRGAQIQFGELLERRTLRQWWDLVSSRLVTCRTSEHASVLGHDDSPFALTTMQHAYWLGRNEGPSLAAPSHFYFEFEGRDINPVRLESAVRRLFQRHEMLRARFLEDGRQQVLRDSPWPGLVTRDFRQLTDVEAAARLQRIRIDESSRRLDVEHGLGFDVQLSLCSPGVTRLHINIDMLLADAASFRVIVAEMAKLYAYPDESLPPISYSFRQYLKDKSNKRSEDGDQLYWQRRAPTLPGPPALPFAIGPNEPEGIRSVRRMRNIDWDVVELLTERSREHGVTLAMTFIGAFSEVLAAWSSSPKFLLNLPLFDRQPLHSDIDRVVGDFTGSILLEVDLSAAVSFAERVARLQDQFRQDVVHGSYPGVSVLRDVWRSNSEAPALAPVVYTSALGLGELFSDLARTTFGELIWMISQTPQVLLDSQLVEEGGELLVNWDAVDGAFSSGVLDAMFGAYCCLLDWLGSSDSDWRDPLPGLLPPDQLAVRAAVNDTRGVESGRLLHEGFFAAASRSPQRAAVLWGESSCWSYGEVADRALRLAALLQERGLRPGETVAVSLSKGPAQVVAVLGILGAGCAYVPVDPQQPEQRRGRILDNARARLVVDEALLEASSQFQPLTEPVRVGNESLAYVIYTSGSTGEPKGVEITHRSAQNTIEAINDRYGVSIEDRSLAVSGLDFDLSVYDMFGLLTAGGSVVTLDEDSRRDAGRWAEQIRRRGVTVWNSVPALLDMLLTAAEGDELKSLRLVLVGGDWVGVDLPGRLVERAPACRFVALGGATEAAIHSTVCEVSRSDPKWRFIPYGIPLRNVSCRVVDALGRDCPDWVAGELWIGGVGVAAGYRGNPELTASQFVNFQEERWYRTGDLGRYWPDGTLEFLGRSDLQVKIRGHRIELGEIETALERHPQVTDAVAVAYGEGDARRLGAAVVGPALGDSKALLEHLAQVVPGYMLPDRLIVLERLPLSANGKVDRQQLAQLLASVPASPAAANEDPPRNEIERQLAELWSELLARPVVSRHDNFFALGGDSLLATRVMGRLRLAGIGGASLRNLFERPSLAPFAATLSPRQVDLPTPLRHDSAGRYKSFPMTEIQRAYWTGRLNDFGLGVVGSYWYWEFDGYDVDVERIEQSWNCLIARHDMLRVVFDDDGNQRVLQNVPRIRIDVKTARRGSEEESLRLLRTSAGTRPPFDLQRWPLFEIRALKYGPKRCRLAFGFDYIALDALSIMTLFAELDALYCDPTAILPNIDITFRDYVLEAAARRECVTECAKQYWTSRLHKLVASALPVRKGDAPMGFTRREMRLSVETWQRLKQRTRSCDLTASTILAAAYAEVISAWSGGQPITLNFTLFDRKDIHPHVPHIVGDFTSLLLVPFSSEPGEEWVATARRLQQEVWTGMEFRSASAIWVMRELAARNGATAAVMPVVFTSTLGVADDLSRLTFKFGSYAGGVSQTPQVLLDSQLVEEGGELLVNWDAVDGAFSSGVLDAMFGAYCCLLDWLGSSDSDWRDPLPGLLPPDQLAVRAAVNDTRGVESGRLLHEGFFAAASRSPQRAAVLWGESSCWSYGEVADRALRLAALLQERGLRPGETVAVSLSKGPAQVVAVLGILGAGCAYVPVDPQQPEQRRGRILDNARARLVVDEALLEASSQFQPLTEPVRVGNESLAYVIYTSGSTGEPKGVEITHRSAQNTIEAINDRYGVSIEDRSLAVSGLDFDLSVYDMFGLLTAGGSVVTLDEDSRRDAGRWAEQIRRRGVTVWNSVPALLDMLLTAAEGDELKSLRLVLVGGDWVGVDLPGRLVERAPACRFVALGGATEAAIWSNAIELEVVDPSWTSIPYGRPLRNAKYRVVDALGRDCPDWVAGELWIGGVGVAAGYRGNPELTASQFVNFQEERWYRTGDLGRYWPDGTLEFLGRSDLQVKIRGHRIELGEIETALERHPQVTDAVAVAYGEGDARRLGAAVVGPALGDSKALLEHLAQVVPGYMLPDRLIVLERLPLSANGKVDRQQLAQLLASVPASPAAANEDPPRNEIERQLAELWSELLARPVVSRHDNFFALGGDSLLATRVAQQARLRFHMEISMHSIFSSPSLADLAALIQKHHEEIETGVIA